MEVFYRVEIPTKHLQFGIGPYLQYDKDKLDFDEVVLLNSTKDDILLLYEKLMERHNNNRKTPGLRRDFPKELINTVDLESYYCGFKSVEDAYIWFDGFIPDLINCGYKLVKYNVMDVIEGKSKRQAFACDIISREIYELSLCNP